MQPIYVFWAVCLLVFLSRWFSIERPPAERSERPVGKRKRWMDGEGRPVCMPPAVLLRIRCYALHHPRHLCLGQGLLPRGGCPDERGMLLRSHIALHSQLPCF